MVAMHSVRELFQSNSALFRLKEGPVTPGAHSSRSVRIEDLVMLGLGREEIRKNLLDTLRSNTADLGIEIYDVQVGAAADPQLAGQIREF